MHSTAGSMPYYIINPQSQDGEDNCRYSTSIVRIGPGAVSLFNTLGLAQQIGNDDIIATLAIITPEDTCGALGIHQPIQIMGMRGVTSFTIISNGEIYAQATRAFCFRSSGNTSRNKSGQRVIRSKCGSVETPIYRNVLSDIKILFAGYVS